MNWILLPRENNQGIISNVRGLINPRKNSHTSYTAGIDFFHEDSESQVLAYTRWNDKDSRLVVIVNLSNQFLAGYTVTNFPADGTWHDLSENYDIEAGNNQIVIDLSEYEVQVLVM